MSYLEKIEKVSLDEEPKDCIEGKAVFFMDFYKNEKVLITMNIYF